jgi:hypothetical protein
MGLPHVAVSLLADAIVSIDRSSRKPLWLAVPDHALLRSDPRGFLSREQLTIRPMENRGSAILFGLLLAMVPLGVAFALFLDYAGHAQPARGPMWKSISVLLSGFALIVLFIWLCISWMGSVLRGASMRLSLDGVRIRHRQKVVVCPWSLFQCRRPLNVDGRRWVISVIDQSCDELRLEMPDGSALAYGRSVSTRFLQVRDDRVIIRGLFQVRLGELAELLNDVAHRFEPASRIADPRGVWEVDLPADAGDSFQRS